MSLAKNFQRELHNQIQIHAAWFPVANTFKIGTYGLIEGGVLKAAGHITDDFGIPVGEIDRASTGKPVAFQSAGVSTSYFAAGGKVDALPQVADADAKLTFKFSAKDSVLYRSSALSVESMRSVQTVADKLGALRKWRSAFRVVSGVYRAESPVVLLASEAGTEISFDAKVSALKALQGGDASASYSLSLSNQRSFSFTGTPGVVGLSLFKLGWFGSLKLLGPEGTAQVDAGSTWGADLEDDL
jgi:hypothetical protein